MLSVLLFNIFRKRSIKNPEFVRLGVSLCGFVRAFFFDFSGECQDLIHFEKVVSGDGDDEVRPEAEAVLLYREVREDGEQHTERETEEHHHF